MRPYKTKPIFVERIWGGAKLSEYNKNTDISRIGESWETGPLHEGIPILIKLIDAREGLSVQVHPDDEFAYRVENAKNGKNEAWVILECEENSSIVYGFNRLLQKEELKALLEKGSITEALNYVKVEKGDFIYIPAGTVHSLGEGILAYEVQQPSDLTYRIYDWDRIDSQGKARELHIDRALDSINYSMELPRITNIYRSFLGDFSDLIDCKYFKLGFRHLKHKELQNYEAGSFRAFTTVFGSIKIGFEDSLILAHKGETCIIPEDYNCVVSIMGLEDAEYIVATK